MTAAKEPVELSSMIEVRMNPCIFGEDRESGVLRTIYNALFEGDRHRS